MSFQVAGKGALIEPETNVKTTSVQGCQSISSDRPDHGLVDNTEHGNDVRVLRLGEELHEDSDIVESPLSVRQSHGTIQKVEGT